MNILPIGFPVFDIRWGNGVIKYNVGFYQVYFSECKVRLYDNYNLDGSSKDYESRATFLSLTPYTLKDGGFTPIL